MQCNCSLVWKGRIQSNTQGSPDRGFALVVCLLLMTLIGILVVGLSGLATIELRRASQADQTALARANARLALMQAIGQLQKTLGPDQRVSASAEILGGNPKQPHWTGVWRSTQNDGSSFFKRNDLAGGMSDARASLKTKPAERVMEWLISGTGDPTTDTVPDPVTLVNVDTESKLEVPKVGMINAYGDVAGHFAWWTGDLGVRANVGTRDPRHDVQIEKTNPQNGAWFRLMASQAADPSMMEGGATLKDDELLRLASTRTVGLTTAGEAWGKKHLFDFTVDSVGVLADVERGGLKRDLTAFFAGAGDIPPLKNLPGLKLDDPLVGDPSDVFNPLSRMRKSGPRFGLLRDWAQLGIPFLGRNVASRLPDIDTAAGRASKALALANEQPVKLAGNVRSSLQPILVEATDFSHISTFRVPNFATPVYQLRFHHYPRVVLWNPYNVDLDFERSMVMIQGNGRQEMWTLNEELTSNGQKFFSQSQWLSFEGGRSTEFNQLGKGIMDTDGYNDPYIGAYYFAIPRTRFGPGECLVFSPARQAEYDCLSPYRPGPYNLNSNELSCTVPPDPSRSYYISGTDIGGGTRFRPIRFWFAPTPAWSVNGRKGVENQSDDTRAVLKHIGTSSTVSFEDFDRAPQIAVVSASLQYGSGREPRISWSSTEQMPMEFLDAASPRPTVIPNVRTREGVRLRWFDEHPSNLINSGPLYNNKTAVHFEDALLGNWNPRASFSIRSPWENIAGMLPISGNLGGPWFFGAYTRDLYDQAVGWNEQTPVLSGGRYLGNPFGQPQEGAKRYVLFDVPRSETGVISLGQLQHAKISELIWHPSYAIGNSLPDPRLGTGGNKGLNRTAAVTGDASSAFNGGFHENMLGWSADTQRSSNKSEWAITSRAVLADLPRTDNLVYDLSFEANQTLWDRFYLSSGSPSEKSVFLSDPENYPLPNARMRLAPAARTPASGEGLKDFHKSASLLMVDGAFNVNSTRVEAWKALLASTRLSGYADSKNVPFPRVLNSPDGAWRNGDSTNSAAAWSGRRELTPEEIHQLAVAITNEVKLRGPFVSLADFVNRRLAEDETGRAGALQAAIEKAGLNSGMTAAYPLKNQTSLPNYTHPDNISDATRMEQTLKPASKAWGAPSWLTQGDILQALGPVLAARSDSFVIRAYGDATDSSGKVTARAWCEAVVQRTPAPLDPDESGLNPRLAGAAGDFGRHFIIQSFRWLSSDEI
jgi:type II secretory pathway pseudopilin PulG